MCVAKEVSSPTPENEFKEIEELFNARKYDDLQVALEERFGHRYLVSSMLNDVRRKVMETSFRYLDEQTDEEFSRLFEAQYPLVRALQALNAPVPATFKTVAEFVLAEDLKAEIRAAEINIGALEELMEDVKALGLKVPPCVHQTATDKITALAFRFARNPNDAAHAMKLVEMLHYADIFGLKPDTVKAQEFVFLGIENLGEEAKNKDIVRALARKLKIAL